MNDIVTFIVHDVIHNAKLRPFQSLIQDFPDGWRGVPTPEADVEATAGEFGANFI